MRKKPRTRSKPIPEALEENAAYLRRLRSERRARRLAAGREILLGKVSPDQRKVVQTDEEMMLVDPFGKVCVAVPIRPRYPDPLPEEVDESDAFPELVERIADRLAQLELTDDYQVPESDPEAPEDAHDHEHMKFMLAKMGRKVARPVDVATYVHALRIYFAAREAALEGRPEGLDLPGSVDRGHRLKRLNRLRDSLAEFAGTTERLALRRYGLDVVEVFQAVERAIEANRRRPGRPKVTGPQLLADAIASAYRDLTGRPPPKSNPYDVPDEALNPYLAVAKDLFVLAGLGGSWQNPARTAAQNHS